MIITVKNMTSAATVDTTRVYSIVFTLARHLTTQENIHGYKKAAGQSQHISPQTALAQIAADNQGLTLPGPIQPPE